MPQQHRACIRNSWGVACHKMVSTEPRIWQRRRNRSTSASSSWPRMSTLRALTWTSRMRSGNPPPPLPKSVPPAQTENMAPRTGQVSGHGHVSAQGASDLVVSGTPLIFPLGLVRRTDSSSYSLGDSWPKVFSPRLFPGPPPSSLSRTGPRTGGCLGWEMRWPTVPPRARTASIYLYWVAVSCYVGPLFCGSCCPSVIHWVM